VRLRPVALVAVLPIGLAALAAPAVAGGSARRFGPPVHVDLANKTGEPSIAVGPDGTEYIVAPDGPGLRTPAQLGRLGGLGTGGSLIWRSTDHGRTWVSLGSYDVPTGGGDTDIAVTPNGTLYASGLSYLACSTVSRSTDRGESWSAMPIAGCGRVPLMNDRQWTATYGDSVVYTAIGDTVNAQIDLVRSVTGSPVIVPSTTMQLSRTGDYQWPGTVDVDQRTGTVYTVWNTAGSPNDCDQAPGASKCTPTQASTDKPDRIEISVLPKDSSTPPVPRVVASRRFDTFDSFVAVTLDKAGAVYVVWSERHPTTVHGRGSGTWTMLARSTDRGRHWSAPVKVNRAPTTTTFPWVTAGDAGRIAVSYYGTGAAGNSPQTVPASATWRVYSSYSTDGGRHFREYPTTGVMDRGAVCTSGTGCTAGGRNLLDFFETAADARGCLVTAFADNTVTPTAAAVVSYVRQTAGPGLLAGRACSVPR
jgi:hypothetical protein